MNGYRIFERSLDFYVKFFYNFFANYRQKNANPLEVCVANLIFFVLQTERNE